MKKVLAILSFSIPLLAIGADDIAPRLGKLRVIKVQKEGKVLSETHRHPYTKFLLGIPVTVVLPNVCTQFVGQQTTGSTRSNPVTMIEVMGSSNPLAQVCIEIVAEPVQTVLTFEMTVVTGGFVPAHGDQTDIVKIANRLYAVTLNIDNNTVTIGSPYAFH